VTVRRRTALLVALAAATAVFATAPGWVGAPLRRLAAYHADGPDPLWDVAVDGRALRRAGRLLPDRTTYALYAPAASPLLAGNLKAGAQLFFAPAFPVQSLTDARWLLSYHAGRVVPPGVAPGRVVRVGRGIYLVQLA
jgi:hypothetical protein